MAPPVFGIGLSRTGTTSLHAAAVLLGLSSIHYPVDAARRWIGGDFSPATTQDFDVHTDLPTPAYYRQLDATHPGARFILTVRDVASWLDSLEAHYARSAPHSPDTVLRDMLRLAVFGIAGFHRGVMREVFERHTEDVMRRFRARGGDLLVLDLARETDPWGAVCGFLALPRPDIAFPHLRTPYLGELGSVRRPQVAAKAAALRALMSGAAP